MVLFVVRRTQAIDSSSPGDIEQSSRLTVALSTVQVAGLVAIVAIGIPHLGEENLLAGASTAGVVTAAALVFFAFVGFDEVITLAEETTNPSRTVPRALLAALGISTVLYVGVAIAGISVLGPAALASLEQPLADVMGAAIGSRSADVVAVVAMMATTNTTLLAVTASSRLQYGMADTGALPASFGRINRRRAPWVAVLLAVIVAAGFVSIGDLSLAASVTDFSVYLVFIAVNVTVILLRFWRPKRRRPFAIKGAIGKVPIAQRSRSSRLPCLWHHSNRSQSCWAPPSPSAALSCTSCSNGLGRYQPQSRRNREAQ